MKILILLTADMFVDADDVPTLEREDTLYLPALTEEEGPPSEELGEDYAALDAALPGGEERQRHWALFDGPAGTAEKAAALAEYLA